MGGGFISFFFIYIFSSTKFGVRKLNKTIREKKKLLLPLRVKLNGRAKSKIKFHKSTQGRNEPIYGNLPITSPSQAHPHPLTHTPHLPFTQQNPLTLFPSAGLPYPHLSPLPLNFWLPSSPLKYSAIRLHLMIKLFIKHEADRLQTRCTTRNSFRICVSLERSVWSRTQHCGFYRLGTVEA